MPQPNPTNAATAARLIQARQAAGYATPDAAAIGLAMNPKTYAVHEQGRASVKPAELRRYAEAFGVSHGWLSAGIGSAPPVNKIIGNMPAKTASGRRLK